jgi:hypothetical protein
MLGIERHLLPYAPVGLVVFRCSFSIHEAWGMIEHDEAHIVGVSFVEVYLNYDRLEPMASAFRCIKYCFHQDQTCWCAFECAVRNLLERELVKGVSEFFEGYYLSGSFDRCVFDAAELVVFFCNWLEMPSQRRRHCE